MPVGSVSWKDAGNVTRLIAALRIAGVDYQSNEPQVSVTRIIAAGSGDATLVSAVPVVVKALRLWNGGAVACHAKLHNAAVPPTVGVTAVVYSASAQAGANNPDPRLSGGGYECTTGLGVTLVTGIANNDTAGVVAASVILEIEWHLAGEV